MTEIGAVFREEWGRAVSILTRRMRSRSRRAAGPTTVSQPTAAWIVTTARNRAIDRLRREQVFARKAELLARLEALPAEEDDVSSIPDDRLALVFGYHLFHAARADLLRRLERDSEAYGAALELGDERRRPGLPRAAPRRGQPEA